MRRVRRRAARPGQVTQAAAQCVQTFTSVPRPSVSICPTLLSQYPTDTHSLARARLLLTANLNQQNQRSGTVLATLNKQLKVQKLQLLEEVVDGKGGGEIRIAVVLHNFGPGNLRHSPPLIDKA